MVLMLLQFVDFGLVRFSRQTSVRILCSVLYLEIKKGVVILSASLHVFSTDSIHSRLISLVVVLNSLPSSLCIYNTWQQNEERLKQFFGREQRWTHYMVHTFNFFCKTANFNDCISPDQV